MTQNHQPTPDQNTLSNSQKSTGGIGRIAKAMRYSLQGFGHAIRYEAAFRQELLIAVPAIVVVWLLPVPTIEKLVLFASVVLVLIVELLNSGIEAIVDRVSTEHHPLSGRAKDLGSAAVMLSLIVMAVCWAMIAGPVVLTALRG
jgi:diacylglycerol kinase (ATP)